jgi:large repetitive protein
LYGELFFQPLKEKYTMVKQIEVVAKDAQGQVQTFKYQPGAKHASKSQVSYKLLVDGSEQLPPGTKIRRSAKSIVVEFADGQTFEFSEWCGTSSSRLIDLTNTEALDAKSATYVPAKEIESGSCLITGDAGQAAGALGEGGGAAAAAGGGFNPLYLAPLALLGLLGGGGGGGDSGSSSGASAKPTSLSGKLSALSDSGVQGDSITNNDKPSIVGTGGTPGTTVELRDAQGKVLGVGTVAADGSWSITPTNALPQGLNSLQIVAKDSAGNASDPTPVLITIDQTPPPAASTPVVAPDMTTATDTGGSGTDNVTTNNRPSFSVPPPAAGETPVLLVDGKQVPATFDALNNTLTPLSPIADGTHTITSAVMDVAGNIGTPSPVLSVNIDATPPTVPMAQLLPSSNSGTPGDNITNQAQPAISGTGTPGDTMTVTFPGGATQTATVAADGTWSVASPAPLAEGSNTLRVVATDPAGNASAPTVLTLIIDSAAPSSPGIAVAEDPIVSAAEAASGGGVPVTVILPPNAAVGDVITVSIDGSPPVRYTVTAADIAAIATPISVLIPTADVIAAGQGPAVITMIYTDAAGNAAPPVIRNLDIDINAPSSPDVAIPEGPVINAAEAANGGGVPVAVTLPADAAVGDVITVSINGSPPVSHTVTAADIAAIATPVNVLIPAADIAAAGQGPAVVTTTYADAGGNAAPPVTTNVTLDTAASTVPSLAITEGPTINAAEATSGGGVPVDVVLPTNAAVGDVITVSIDGSTPVSYTLTAADVAAITTPISILIPTADIAAAGQGPAVVTTLYTDAAGNADAPVTIDLEVDTVVPSSPSVAIPSGPAINASEAASDVPVAVTLPTGAAVGDIITVSIDGSTPVSHTVTAADVAAIGTPINVLIPAADIAAAGQGPAVVTTTYADAAGNMAAPVTTDLAIDTAGPASPMVAVAEGPTINATEAASGGGVPVAVTLPANAAVGDVITISIDGSTPVSYTVTAADVAAIATPISVLIPTADITAAGQGPAMVTTTYADAAGNAATPVITNLTIDTVAPSSPTVAVAEGPVINAAETTSGGGVPVAVTLPANAAVGDVITVSIDGSIPVSYTVTAADIAAIATPISVLIPTADITAAGQGPAVVTTTYVDVAGNAATPVTTNLELDTAGPSSPSVAIPEGPVINAAEAANGGGVPVAVTLPADAAVGDVITVSINGSTPVSYTVTATDIAAIATPISVLIPTADIAAAGQGPAVVTTTYADAGGNVATPVTTNLDIDTTAPSSPTVAVAEGPVINAAEATSGGGVPVAVTLPANAAVGDVITVSIDGSTPVSYTVTAADVAAIATPISVLVPTADIAAAGQGPAAVTTTYADAAGNAATPVTTNLSIDTTAPSSPTVAIPVGPAINASEAASGVPVAVTLPADAAVGDVITVSIDGSTPVSYTVTAADIAAIATPISVLIPAADMVAAGEGPAVVTTTYTDAAGNAATPVTTNLTIDTATSAAPTVAVPEGPVINALEATSGGGVPVAVTLPADAAVGDVIAVSIDGSTPVSYTVTAADIAAIATPISMLIPTSAITAAGQGPAVVTTTYADAAGNAATPVTTNLTIDTTAPSAPTVAVPEGPVINAAEATSGGGMPVAVTLPANTAVGDVITVSIDGSPPVNYTVTAADVAAIATPINVLIPTADIAAAGQGPAVVTTTYTDAAGNAAAPVTTNLTIDTATPAAPTVAVPEGPVINAAEAASGGGVPVAVTLPANAAVGDIITVSIDGRTPVSYTVTAADVAALATPVSILIPTADITAAGQGPAVVTTTYADAAGNAATPVTTNLTIDTTAPAAPTVAIAEGPAINAAEATSGGGVPVAITLPANAAVGDIITVNIDGSTPVSYTVTAADIAAIATPINVLIPTADIASAGQGAAVVTTTYTDAAGNAATPVTSNLTIDTVVPTLTSSSPADNATNASPSGTITLTYNEPLTAGATNQTITLYNFTTGAVVETFNVTTGVGSNGGTLTLSGSAVTLNLADPMAYATHYDVQVQAGAFSDAAGNTSSAIATNTALDFTTGSPAATVTVANIAYTAYSQFLHTTNINLVNTNALGLLPAGGFGTAYFTGVDDASANVSITPAFSSGLNWFGTNYTSVGIGSNGYITFGHLNNSYSALGIPGYTTGGIIAVQFDDWRSRFFTLTGVTPGGNSTGADNTFFAAYQNAGSGVVTLTYDDVGPYAKRAVGATDGLTTNNYDTGNAEQIRLVAMANGETVIQLVYESVNWVNGNTGYPTAGWTKGDTMNYGQTSGNVPGASTGGISGTVNFLDIESTSNVGIPGVYEWVIGTNGLVGAGVVPMINTHDTGSAQLAVQLTATGGTASYAQDAIHWDPRFTLVGNQIQANAGATFAPTETSVEMWVQVTDNTTGLVYPKIVNVALFDQIGGSGNDLIAIHSAADISKLTTAIATQVVMNGGAGEDTLVFTGTGLNLDLTAVQNSALINVEKVDLGTGNTMKLGLADVFAMSAPNQFNSGNGWVGLPGAVTLEQLVIDGNASDTLNIFNSGTNAGFWNTTSAGTVTHGGQSYRIYNSTANTGQLLIDTDVIVVFT